jgi:hypothetical protein
MFGRPAIEEPGVTNVPQQVNVHRSTV